MDAETEGTLRSNGETDFGSYLSSNWQSIAGLDTSSWYGGLCTQLYGFPKLSCIIKNIIWLFIKVSPASNTSYVASKKNLPVNGGCHLGAEPDNGGARHEG